MFKGLSCGFEGVAVPPYWFFNSAFSLTYCPLYINITY